jgi:hypothetical protein
MDLPKNIALVDTPPSIASTRQQMSTNVKKINNTCISDFFFVCLDLLGPFRIFHFQGQNVKMISYPRNNRSAWEQGLYVSMTENVPLETG